MNNSKYFRWLTAKAGIFKTIPEYINVLSSETYKYKNPLDENRALDGKALRLEYGDDTGDMVTPSDLREPATYLEVMVALADRIENDIMCDPLDKPDPSKWFKLMVDNLGLEYEGAASMHSTLDRFNDKVFPVTTNLKEDQLWSKASEFINEHYYI